MSEAKNTSAIIKAFISYSHTSEYHKKWVLDLANRLRSDGIDVILDQTHLRFGHDANKFMEQTVADPSITKVVIIVDLVYAEKATGRSGGVGAESQVISPEIYANTEQTKFIPIIRERDPNQKAVVPPFLAGRMYIDMSGEKEVADNYEMLLRDLAGQPLHVPAPLGRLPSYLADTSAPASPASSKLRSAQSAIQSDKTTATGFVQDALDAVQADLVGRALDSDTIKGSGELDTVLFSALNQWTPRRNEFLDFIRTDLRYAAGRHLIQPLPRFFQACLPLIPRENQQGAAYKSHLVFAIYEMFLSSAALMIDAEAFEPLSALLNARYRMESYRGDGLYRFAVLRPGSELYLEQAIKKRDNQNYYSPLAHLLQERVEDSYLHFNKLCEADCLLYLRDLLDTAAAPPNDLEGYYGWWPYTLPYVTHEYGISSSTEID